VNSLKLSKNELIPLYIQIAEIIKNKITNKQLKPGQSIGSQRQLEKEFSVSTVTVRQAINLLEKEGLVVTKHGKGTYVKPVKFNENLINLQSLSEVMTEKGLKPMVSVIKISKVVTPSNSQAGYWERFGSECLYIERLHSVNNKPIAFAQIYLPYSIGKSLTKEELEERTVYDLIENKLCIKLGEAEQLIEACPADKKLAEFLKVNQGYPLLRAERVSFDFKGLPLEHIVFFYKHDEYSFKIKLKRVTTFIKNGKT
jgi:GntR family transcriptional regulator